MALARAAAPKAENAINDKAPTLVRRGFDHQNCEPCLTIANATEATPVGVASDYFASPHSVINELAVHMHRVSFC
jgi:hypothetical protein